MNASVSLLPKGTAFIRYARCLALAKGKPMHAASEAAELYGATSGPARWLRAASQAGTTLPGESWGSELAEYSAAAAEFFGLARERSIPGRMAGLQRMPLAVRLIRQTAAATASWVGEGKPKPISEARFAADTMEPNKIAAITVVSTELLKVGSPQAESWLRSSLTDALVKVLNVSFIDPANAGVPNEEPVAISHGAPSVAATGVWADDLAALLALFTGNLETAYFITNGVVASGLSGPAQPNLTVRGGELSGIPTITDPSVPAGVLVLADAAQIAYGESDMRADASTQGSIEMETAPTGTTAKFGLWQSNAVALRVEQLLNWQKGADGSVVVLTGV